MYTPRRALVGLCLLVLASAPHAALATTEPVQGWQVVWQRPLGFVTKAPRLGNGLLYAFVGGDVVALDAASGELRWQYLAPELPQAGPVLGCLCVGTSFDFNGRDIYVLAGANELRSLDARTGQARWARPVGEAVVTPTVRAEGVVVFGAAQAGGDDLYGLDERSGATRWKVPIDGRLVPWLAADGATVLAATGDRRLMAVDAVTGRILWTADMPADVTLPPPDRVGGGMLTLAGDGTVLALDTATGRARWAAEADGWPGPPLLADGRAFVATFSGQLLALDDQSGQRQWAVDTGRSFAGGDLALGAGGLYAPSAGRELLALDPSDGRPRWSGDVGQVMSAPDLAGESLLAGTLEGDLVVLDPASGEELARLGLAESVFHSPLLGDGLVYVAADGRQGSLLTALRPPAR